MQRNNQQELTLEQQIDFAARRKSATVQVDNIMKEHGLALSMSLEYTPGAIVPKLNIINIKRYDSTDESTASNDQATKDTKESKTKKAKK